MLDFTPFLKRLEYLPACVAVLLVVTAFYGVYDPATRSLTYASAGHPSPLLRRASSGGVINIDGTRGLPMGIDADELYPTATTQLAPGDLLLIYTDGFSEARAPNGDFLGPDGLSATLADAPAAAADVMAATLNRVEAFTDNAPPSDDRTLIAVRVA